MKTKILNLVVWSILLLSFGCSNEVGNEQLIPDIALKEQPNSDGDVLTLVQIAQGFLCGSEDIPQQSKIIKNKLDWENLKKSMNLYNNETDNFIEKDIDFSAYQVVAVFDKIKGNGGWSIDITNVTEYADSILVSVKNLNTGNLTSVITQPYHIVKIPVSEKQIVFQYDDTNTSDNDDVDVSDTFQQWIASPNDSVTVSLSFNSSDGKLLPEGKLLIDITSDKIVHYHLNYMFGIGLADYYIKGNVLHIKYEGEADYNDNAVWEISFLTDNIMKLTFRGFLPAIPIYILEYVFTKQSN
jgi:hypothetical protein